MVERRYHSTLLALTFLTSSFASACGPATEPEPEAPDVREEVHMCGPSHEPQLAVIRKLDFIRAEGDISRGMDLDMHVSGSDSSEGCFKSDYTTPEGVEGIDNQFARLLPAIEAVGGAEGFESAIQRAINNGDVLLGMQLHRLEDIEQDACLEVRFQRLDGRPTIGALGLIEPGQTFDPDLEAPTSSVDDAIIEGGVLLAGPFELSLPMQIGNNQLLVTIFDAQIEARVHEDGSIEGMMAGAIEVAEILELLETIEDGTDLLGVIRSVLSRSADLDKDEEGKCQKLSLAVDFEAAPAFLYADAEELDAN